MSPLRKFESSARAIWNSALAPAEKSARLDQLHGIIVRYAGQMDAMADANRGNPETEQEFERIRGAISRLSGATEELSQRALALSRAA